MSLSTLTDWVCVDWFMVKGYRVEFRIVSGVKQQRHHWLRPDGEIVADKWIRGV